MAPYSSTLAWRIPWMEEPGSAGSGARGWEETHRRAGGCAMCEQFQTLRASCQGPGSSGSLWNLDLGQFALKGVSLNTFVRFLTSMNSLMP